MAQKTLNFQLISDARFDADPKAKIDEMLEQLKKKLKIKDVELRYGTPVHYHWEDWEQYRVNCKVAKFTRRTTWKDIMELVNSVHPTEFKLI